MELTLLLLQVEINVAVVNWCGRATYGCACMMSRGRLQPIQHVFWCEIIYRYIHVSGSTSIRRAAVASSRSSSSSSSSGVGFVVDIYLSTRSRPKENGSTTAHVDTSSVVMRTSACASGRSSRGSGSGSSGSGIGGGVVVAVVSRIMSSAYDMSGRLKAQMVHSSDESSIPNS